MESQNWDISFNWNLCIFSFKYGIFIIFFLSFRWCRLLRIGKLANIVVAVLDSVSKDDFDNYKDCFPNLTNIFEMVIMYSYVLYMLININMKVLLKNVLYVTVILKKVLYGENYWYAEIWIVHEIRKHWRQKIEIYGNYLQSEGYMINGISWKTLTFAINMSS